jgi:hypothetical protein
MMSDSTSEQEIIKRPLGLWILTIYAAFFAGIAPLVVAIIALVTGNSASIPGGSVLGVIGAILISGSIVYYTFRTWQGQDRARRHFLVLISVHYVLIAINNYLFLQSGEVPVDDVNRIWGRVGRGILYPAIFIWYFTRPHVTRFFSSTIERLASSKKVTQEQVPESE